MERNTNKTDKAYRLHQSKTFCMLPWTHTHILPSSKVLPCCVWPYDKSIGDVNQDSLAEIWNREEYKQLRFNMLNEQPSEGCRHCYDVEAAGGKSIRNISNRNLGSHYEKFVPRTASDGSHDKVNLTYFDVRFSNICNFKCRGCSPELSSAWQSDFEKAFGLSFPKYVSVSPNPKLWAELHLLLETVEMAYFAGGEPLIMDDHYRVLDEFIKMKKDVRLSYNTNLSRLTYRDKHICDYWNNFSDVQVGVSIDDMGRRGEYFRHGMEWDKTVENMHTILKRSPHIYLSVNCTVNAMNVLYLTELHNFLISEKLIEPGYGFSVNLLMDPQELRSQVLPASVKKMAAEKIKAYMIAYRALGWSDQQLMVTDDSMLSILRYLETDLSHLLPQFFQRTQKLDELRNESFKDVYPELAAYLEYSKDS